MLAARKPPNGKTLALLCLKLVKHTSGAKIGEKKQVVEKQMNLTAAEFRKWKAVDAEHFLFSSVVVVFPRLRRGRLDRSDERIDRVLYSVE
jgi:hypothetical protein